VSRRTSVSATPLSGVMVSCFSIVDSSGVIVSLQSGLRLPLAVVGMEETTGSPFGPSTGLISVRLGVSGRLGSDCPILWKVEHSVNGILVGKVMPSPRAVFTGTNHSQALGPITSLMLSSFPKDQPSGSLWLFSNIGALNCSRVDLLWSKSHM